MKTATTCGITIYDARQRVIRSCGQPATKALIVRGDQLFTYCSRHRKRMDRAFPEAASA